MDDPFDLLVEILEAVFTGVIEDRRMPGWARALCFALLSLVCLCLVALFVFLAVIAFQTSILSGIVVTLLLVGLLVLVGFRLKRYWNKLRH